MKIDVMNVSYRAGLSMDRLLLYEVVHCLSVPVAGMTHDTVTYRQKSSVMASQRSMSAHGKRSRSGLRHPREGVQGEAPGVNSLVASGGAGTA